MVNKTPYWKKALLYGATTIALAIGTPQAQSQTLEAKVQTEQTLEHNTQLNSMSSALATIIKISYDQQRPIESITKEYDQTWKDIDNKIYTPEALATIIKISYDQQRPIESITKEYDQTWKDIRQK